MMKTASISLALVAVALSVTAGAQPGELKFDVASIKPNMSGSNRVNMLPMPGGRFTATNVTVRDLLAVAYGTGRPFPPSSIVNAPSWMSRDRFDILAKADGDPSREQISLMLRALLADRFRLAVHTEARERPIYLLTWAKREGVFGPGLRASTLTCSGPRESLPAGCEMLSVPGTLKARGAPIEALLRMLTGWVEDHREVWDRTGLAGTFDMDMKWTPDRMPVVPSDASPELAQALRSIDANGPSLFTAVQEQLGLKLVADKDQTDVLVIDHLEPPSPD